MKELTEMVQAEMVQTGQMDLADYRDEEGFLCCGKCHTRKEVESVTIKAAADGSLIKVPFIRSKRCLCEEEAYQKQEAYYKEQDRRRKIEDLKRRCFTDRAFYNCRLEQCDKVPDKIQRICRQYVEHWEENKRENIGLLFWGGVGNGKTTMAAAIANALLEQEVSVMMRNFASFLNATFEEKEELLRRVPGVGLLILDDFGMERSTDYGIETVTHIIDTRYNSKKPVIITTNLPLETFKKQTDIGHRRIYDRISEMCAPVFFDGESIRKGIHDQKMAKFAAQVSGSNTEE